MHKWYAKRIQNYFQIQRNECLRLKKEGNAFDVAMWTHEGVEIYELIVINVG